MCKERMHAVTARFFEGQKQRIVQKIQSSFGKLKKDDDKSDKLIDEFDFAWYQLIHEIQGELVAAAEQGVNVGAAQTAGAFRSNPREGMRQRGAASSYARQFASDRAAELVGMKADGNGNFIENPDAQWAISDTTREELKRTITQAFTEGWTPQQLSAVIEASAMFSSDRADMIAKTEIARSQSYGNLQSWIQSGAILETKWQTSADHPCCDNCDLYASKGSVPVGHEYAPGVLAPPDAHPNCECALVVTKVNKT